jgi:hypothetical protein
MCIKKWRHILKYETQMPYMLDFIWQFSMEKDLSWRKRVKECYRCKLLFKEINFLFAFHFWEMVAVCNCEVASLIPLQIMKWPTYKTFKPRSFTPMLAKRLWSFLDMTISVFWTFEWMNDQFINQSIYQLINQPTNQPTNQINNQ